MARYRPSFKLQQELKIAQAREEYQTEYYNQYQFVAAVQNRAMTRAVYASLYYDNDFLVRLTNASKDEFGGLDALGLSDADADLKGAKVKPDNITPSMVKMTLGAAEPVAHKAYGKSYGSRVINYAKSTDGNAQAHFSSPISERAAAATKDQPATAVNIEAVRAKAEAIAEAKKAAIGVYGRFYFVLERVTINLKEP